MPDRQVNDGPCFLFFLFFFFKKKGGGGEAPKCPHVFFFNSILIDQQSKREEKSNIAPPNFAILIPITIKCIVTKGEFLQQNKSH